MTPTIESHLMAMSGHLRKIHKHRASVEAKSKQHEVSDGKIIVNSNSSTVRGYVASLEPKTKNGFLLQNRWR